MTTFVVLMVLFGALLHAGWNAVIKGGEQPFYNTVLIALGAAIAAVVVLPMIAQPALASWPYIAGSVAAHIVYFLMLYATYRAGDMSQAYPIMRGTPPLLVSIISAPLVGESLSIGHWLGIVVISSGIFLMAAGSRARTTGGLRVLGWAPATAVVIAIYTVNDGVGARLSEAPLGYTLWMFLIAGTGLSAICVMTRGRDFLRYAGSQKKLIVVGGIGTAGSYAIALWAMTRAPVAAVAALRETSILFGALIAVFMLKERLGTARWIAVGTILIGVVLVRLG